MKAGRLQPAPAPVVFIIIILNLSLDTSCQPNELKICQICGGTVQNGTAVARFCASSSGRIRGRCCVRNSSAEPEHVIGLDLSNCSLSRVEDFKRASTALMIDLSLNPIVNINDSVFQGFIVLDCIILPSSLVCPGGNASWEKVDVSQGNRVCQGQRDLCNQTGQMSLNCPENSLCAPYGPGFFECSCADNHHGYKCLREGEFPVFQVFSPLGVSTVLISLLLWVTQRRKVKSF